MIKIFPLEMKRVKYSMIVIKKNYVLKFKIFGQYSIMDKVQKKFVPLIVIIMNVSLIALNNKVYVVPL